MAEADLISYLIVDAIQSATYSDNDLSELEKAWLFSNSNEECSFNWYCDLIGIHADKLKEGLFKFMSCQKLGRDKGPGILNN